MATFASVEAAKIAAGEIEPNDDASSKYEPKKLSTVGISSIFDLKNELLKKKAETVKSSLTNEYRAGKSGLLAVKKDERERLKQEKLEAKDRIKALASKIRQDELDALEKSRQRLKEKSDLYDKLSQGNTVLHHKDDTPVEFMVDFQHKSREEHRRTPEYEDRPSSSKPTNLHFDPDAEHRVYGPSHIRLSTDETTRQKEIADIKEFSKKTEIAREKQNKLNERREKERREKINRMRKQAGLPELAEPEKEVVEEIPLPPPVDVKKEREEQESKRLKSDREWDRGKDRYNYNKWIEKEREVRDDDFRPPDSYNY